MALSDYIPLPSANGVLGFAIWVLIGLVVAGICGYFIWRTWNNRQFTFTVRLHRSIHGQSVPIADYKGGYFSVSRAGDSLFRVKGKWKVFKYLPKPKQFVDKRLVYYQEGKDGEWINFVMTDIDRKRKEMGAFFVHEDMRLGRINVGDILEKQLTKKSFWDKWKDTIMSIIFILITTICLVVLFAKLGSIVNSITVLADKLGTLADKLQLIADKLTSLIDYFTKLNGSGVVNAPTGVVGA
jgi:hypothetical protein